MSQPTSKDETALATKAKALGIKYIMVTHTSFNEATRAITIPVSAVDTTLKNGCSSHPYLHFDWPGSQSEMILFPDPQSFIQLPWKPEYGWLSSDLYMDGKPFYQCPRGMLKKQMDKAKSMGYNFFCGFEPEFILLKNDKFAYAVGDESDLTFRSYREPLVLMRTDKVINKITDALETLGWGLYAVNKEAAPSQFEFNFQYSDAVTMADRFAFFKFMVKDIAAEEGYRATFMPQPFETMVAGTGCHVNMSLWNNGVNMFVDEKGPNGISLLANQFLAGLLEHAKGSTAITNASVNSYKRLNNAHWAPGAVTYGHNNRLTMMRIPSKDRLEQRLADSTSNPYLLIAVLLAAGLDGIKKQLEPGKCCDENMDDFERLPDNFLDALRELESSSFLRSILGDDFIKAYVTCKKQEWTDYSNHVTSWEQMRYLNC